MNLIIAILITPVVAIATGVTVGAIETFTQWLDEQSDKRILRKWYNICIKVWKQLAIEETDPIEKGYKTARLCNYAYEKNNI